MRARPPYEFDLRIYPLPSDGSRPWFFDAHSCRPESAQTEHMSQKGACMPAVLMHAMKVSCFIIVQLLLGRSPKRSSKKLFSAPFSSLVQKAHRESSLSISLRHSTWRPTAVIIELTSSAGSLCSASGLLCDARWASDHNGHNVKNLGQDDAIGQALPARLIIYSHFFWRLALLSLTALRTLALRL